MRRESTTVYSDFSEVNCYWEYDGSHVFRVQDADKGVEVVLSGEQIMGILAFVASKVSEYIE